MRAKSSTIRKVARVQAQNIPSSFYIFNASDSAGFVIVAADDCAHPVLGYSDHGYIDPEQMPANMRAWLQGYDRQIQWAREHQVQQDSTIAAEWNAYLNANASAVSISPRSSATDFVARLSALFSSDVYHAPAQKQAVSPLLQTQWDQMPYYNDKCPRYSLLYGKASTGCVATAMAQVMKYHNYPTKGNGSHSYYHSNNYSTFGTLSADFGNTTYDWANMPTQLSESSSDKQVNAVSTLMYHCGVSVDMDYNTDGNGQSGTQAYKVPDALIEYFDYDYSAQITAYDILAPFSSYSAFTADILWQMIIQNQLDNGLPVLMGGTSEDGTSGHAFVCDGYNADGYFHFNWGWGGSYDSYYALFALTPTYNGDYSTGEQAVVDIMPQSTTSAYNLQMSIPAMFYHKSKKDWDSYTTALYSSCRQKDTLLYFYDILNVGNSAFQGDILVGIIYDKNDDKTDLKLVGYLPLKKDLYLPAHAETSGIYPFVIDPKWEGGKYYATIVSVTGTDSVVVGADYIGVNLTPFTVIPVPSISAGKYIVMGIRGTDDNQTAYYMTADVGTAKTKRYQAVSAAMEDINDLCGAVQAKEDKDKYIWELVSDGEQWKLKNGTQYSTWTSGNSATLGSTGISLSIDNIDTAGDDENLLCGRVFFNDGTNVRYLALNPNAGNDWFAYYTSYADQLLIFCPYVEKELPKQYVILAQRNSSSNWFYMTSDLGTAKNKRFQAVDTGTTDIQAVNTAPTDTQYIWTIEETDNGVWLKNGTQYAAWTSGNTATLSDTPLALQLNYSAENHGTLSFVDADSNTRYLALNATAGNNYFAFYSGTQQITALLIIPYGQDITTALPSNEVHAFEVQDGMVYSAQEFHIYDLQGQDVTSLNGTLHGVYIVVSAMATQKLLLP